MTGCHCGIALACIFGKGQGRSGYRPNAAIGPRQIGGQADVADGVEFAVGSGIAGLGKDLVAVDGAVDGLRVQIDGCHAQAGKRAQFACIGLSILIRIDPDLQFIEIALTRRGVDPRRCCRENCCASIGQCRQRLESVLIRRRGARDSELLTEPLGSTVHYAVPVLVQHEDPVPGPHPADRLRVAGRIRIERCVATIYGHEVQSVVIQVQHQWQ
ncbi:hypothetical protein D9M72_210390 [compost metagenome]